jgi:hypothetical protein
MPVIDLADYLGMPAQAPADPLFYQNQRNAAYAQEAVDFNQRVAAREQLNRLQRQAPVLQAQQAQLAYDNIAKEANDLRKKQEIEAQVERAASELAGGNLNPESDDFAVKYRDLATRNPLAFSDPRFSTVAGLYENQYKGYQQAKQQRAEAERAAAAKANEDLRTAIGGYLQYGGDSEIAKNIKSVEEAKYLEGQMKKAARDKIGTRGGAKDIAGQMMQKDYELVGSRLKAMVDEGKNVLYDKDGAEIPNPKFDELAKEHDRLFNELRGSYQGIYNPAEAAPATQTRIGGVSGRTLGDSGIPVRPKEQAAAPAALPASILASALPQVQAPKIIQEEKIDSTAEILNTDLGIPGNAEFINNKVREESLSLDARKQVLKKLEDAIKNPPSMKYLNRYQVDANKQSIANAYSNIKNSLVLAETQEKIVNPVWTRAKKTMESTVNEWAKKNGYEPETIWQTILQESESGPAREVDPLSESGEKILPLTAEEILGEELSKENTDLLTVKPQIEAIRNAEAPVGARIGRFFGEESITNYDILKQIAKEKFKPVASDVPTLPAISQENAVKKTNLLKSVGIGANG